MLGRLPRQAHKLAVVVRTARFRWLVGVLFAGDFVMASLHLGNALTRHEHPERWISQPAFNLGTDRGFGEMFGYSQLAACVVFAFQLFRVRGSAVYALAAGLYLLALVDDVAAIHEYVGHHLRFLTTNHRIGELAAMCLPAGLALVLFVWTLRRTRKADAVYGAALLTLFSLLAVFAVFLDSLHVLVVIEETAELATVSLHCAFLFALSALVLRRRNPLNRLGAF